MIIEINKKIKRILNCNDIQLNGCGSYIINHTLQQIAGPYNNISNTVNKAFNVCRTTRKHTNMTQLLLHKDTILSDSFYDYPKVSTSGNIKNLIYKTHNNIKDVNECCGIYTISSDKLNTVYVGETITTFHKRWLKHYSSPMAQVKQLLQQDDVIFSIVEICIPNKVTTLAKEHSTITTLKETTDKIILGGSIRFS